MPYVTEDFTNSTETDVDDLTNWGAVLNTVPLVGDDPGRFGADQSGLYAGAMYTAQEFTYDQWAQVYIDSSSTGTGRVGCAVRMSSDSGGNYYGHHHRSSGGELFKIVAGSYTLIQASVGIPA